MACYNMVIPYLCPEMSEKQKEALHYCVKIPLVYTNVQIRNWESFQKLGVNSIYAPGSYFSSVSLGFSCVHRRLSFRQFTQGVMPVTVSCAPRASPGFPPKNNTRAGRWELLSTPFDVFERNIRDQLGRMLAGGGFDSAKDIQAITVNRWPHGYAYEYNPLFEPLDRPDSEGGRA